MICGANKSIISWGRDAEEDDGVIGFAFLLLFKIRVLWSAAAWRPNHSRAHHTERPRARARDLGGVDEVVARVALRTRAFA